MAVATVVVVVVVIAVVVTQNNHVDADHTAINFSMCVSFLITYVHKLCQLLVMPVSL